MKPRWGYAQDHGWQFDSQYLFSALVKKENYRSAIYNGGQILLSTPKAFCFPL